MIPTACRSASVSCPRYERALAMGHPRFSLMKMVQYFKPVISHHSEIVKDLPSKAIRRLSARWRDCSFGVAHLQFSGEYPCVPSILSSVCKLVGLFPTSEQNESNDRQRSQTVTGGIFPPYKFQSLQVGSSHLRHMPFHVSYRGFRLVNLDRPAILHWRHSMALLRSSLILWFSGVSSCPYLQKLDLRLVGIANYSTPMGRL